MPVAPSRGGTGPEYSGSTGSGKSAPSGGPSGPGAPPQTLNIPAPGSGPAGILASFMVQILRGAADRTVYGDSMFLNPDDQVYVISLGSNASDNCFISTTGNSDAKFPPRLQLKKGANFVPVTVRSLNQIGVYSDTPGDGVLVVVQKRP